MLIRCDSHGEVESTPDMFGVVHCPTCFSQKIQKFLKDMKSDQSMTDPKLSSASIDDFEFVFTCSICGSEFPDGHDHTDDECVVHKIMSS